MVELSKPMLENITTRTIYGGIGLLGLITSPFFALWEASFNYASLSSHYSLERKEITSEEDIKSLDERYHKSSARWGYFGSLKRQVSTSWSLIKPLEK
jgi:hypothetical protein